MSRVQDRVHTGQETHDGDNKREVAMFTSVIEAMMLSKMFSLLFSIRIHLETGMTEMAENMPSGG